MNLYIHTYIYIYIYICNHEKNVPSRLSPQGLCGNSCTWAHDVYIYLPAKTNKSVFQTFSRTFKARFMSHLEAFLHQDSIWLALAGHTYLTGAS